MRTACVVVMAALAIATPVDAAPERVVYEAPVPGTALTPYWFAPIACIGCNPDGTVRRILRAAGHDAPVFAPREVMETCDRPFPPESWDDLLIGVPPVGSQKLYAVVFPHIDWDLVVCSFRAPTNEELRSDPADAQERWRLEAFADHRWETCPGVYGIYPVGCPDAALVTVVADRPYKLVAYNWAGIPQAPGSYEWR